MKTLQTAHERELAACHETVRLLQQRLNERDEQFAMQKRRKVPVDYYALKAKVCCYATTYSTSPLTALSNIALPRNPTTSSTSCALPYHYCSATSLITVTKFKTTLQSQHTYLINIVDVIANAFN